MKKNELRNFGLIWSVIFLVIALMPITKNENVKIWAIILFLLFILTTFTKPQILRYFYKIWTKIGTVIGNIVSKFMLSVLFYLLFVPVALILRLMGKDILNKKLDKKVSTYWITRERQPESMKNQF